MKSSRSAHSRGANSIRCPSRHATLAGSARRPTRRAAPGHDSERGVQSSVAIVGQSSPAPFAGLGDAERVRCTGGGVVAVWASSMASRCRAVASWLSACASRVRRSAGLAVGTGVSAASARRLASWPWADSTAACSCALSSVSCCIAWSEARPVLVVTAAVVAVLGAGTCKSAAAPRPSRHPWQSPRALELHFSSRSSSLAIGSIGSRR